MKSFQRLYDEMQMGERADWPARITAVAAAIMGAFRRLPARELTTAEFLKVFTPGHFESVHDFLAEHAARPLPWKELPPELVPDDVVAAADRAAEQRFSFLGQDFYFRESVNWLHSLGPGGVWPRARWADIPFASVVHLGDIKPCWEMNRHQFFVTLALAWIKTKDEKYGAAVARFVDGWCDQNTPEMGVNYISGLEIGARCVAWVFANRLLRGCPAWTEAAQERLHRNIYSQALHIAEYLTWNEKAESTCHLLGQSAALAWVALQYPEWQESEKWLRHALTVLWPALDAQVAHDGMHFEASFGYQLAVVEFLLLLFTEMRRQKRPLPSKSYAILEKMAQALRFALQPDGTLPGVNDNDDGFAVPLPLSQAERVQGVMAVMAALYDRPDFKSVAGPGFGLYAHLLLGEAGAHDFRIVAQYPETFPFLGALRASNIAVLREDGDWLMLKNNPDPFPLSGHNHADLLSMLLFMNGKPVLVDAGTYRFSDDRGIRNALRSTAAHNTITVDGKGQADPLRNFGWSARLKAGETHAYEENGIGIIDAQHDCYDRFDVTHRRVIVWLRAEGAILVIDQMTGKGPHGFDQYWHFAPGTRAEDAGAFQYRLSRANETLGYMRFLRDKDLDRHEAMLGSDSNPAALYSPHYGAVEPGVVLKHSWTSTLSSGHPSHRVTVFSRSDLKMEFSDVWNAEFRFNEWNIDLTQTPAKVTKAKN